MKVKLQMKRLLLSFLATFCLLTGKVYAEEISDTELPIISNWLDGKGYQEDGTMLTETWAYDSKNPAGRYVLFDEEGNVSKKTDQWEKREDVEDNFTSTEQSPSTIALRAETFSGFSGTIQIILEEKSGVQKKCELNQDNHYEKNVKVNSGGYFLKEVQAVDTDYSYQTIYPPETYLMGKEGLKLLKIQVTEEKMGLAEETEIQSDTEKKKPLETKEVKEQSHQSKAKNPMPEIEGERIFFIAGIIMVVGIAGYLLLRHKKNKYQ